MTTKNIIAKMLTIGLVLNSVTLNSVASILSEDRRYETFSGNNIGINDIYEPSNEIVKIEGKSVPNIVGSPTWISNYNVINVNDKGEISFDLNALQSGGTSNPYIF